MGVPLAPCRHSARVGLFGVALLLHSYATLRNGFAAPAIPNAKKYGSFAKRKNSAGRNCALLSNGKIPHAELMCFHKTENSAREISCFRQMEKFRREKSRAFTKWKNSAGRNHLFSPNEKIPQGEFACFYQTEKFREQKSLVFIKRKNSASRNRLFSSNGKIPRVEITCFHKTEKFRREKLLVFIKRQNSAERNCVLLPNGITPL